MSSVNCNMYWLLFNKYPENSGFGPTRVLYQGEFNTGGSDYLASGTECNWKNPALPTGSVSSGEPHSWRFPANPAFLQSLALAAGKDRCRWLPGLSTDVVRSSVVGTKAHTQTAALMQRSFIDWTSLSSAMFCSHLGLHESVVAWATYSLHQQTILPAKSNSLGQFR